MGVGAGTMTVGVRKDAREASETPNPKPQTPKKPQASSSKKWRSAFLGFGAWGFSGFWVLGFPLASPLAPFAVPSLRRFCLDTLRE